MQILFGIVAIVLFALAFAFTSAAGILGAGGTLALGLALVDWGKR